MTLRDRLLTLSDTSAPAMTTHHAERPAPPGKGMVRAAPLGPIPELLREFGRDPGPLLRQCGLPDEAILRNPDENVLFSAAGKLFLSAARVTGCPHFGLLVGQRGNVSMLGAPGFLLRNAPDVRTALNELVSNLDLHDRGATPFLEVIEDTCVVGYEIYQPGIEGTVQICDCSMAMGWNILRTLCGPEWQPLEIRFRHDRPADVEPYRRLFHAPLRFNARHTGLVFSARWLDAPVQHADPLLRQHFVDEIRILRRHSNLGFRDQAYKLLVMLIGSQRCSLEQVAEHFSMHPRTLNRRLSDAGTSFRELYNEARHEMARQLLRETGSSISAIATLLGYSDATAFNRAFSQWEGVSPARWRKRKNGVEADPA